MADRRSQTCLTTAWHGLFRLRQDAGAVERGYKRSPVTPTGDLYL